MSSVTKEVTLNNGDQLKRFIGANNHENWQISSNSTTTVIYIINIDGSENVKFANNNENIYRMTVKPGKKGDCRIIKESPFTFKFDLQIEEEHAPIEVQKKAL
jgi:hypothetical protein